jgi:hypothetical protein
MPDWVSLFDQPFIAALLRLGLIGLLALLAGRGLRLAARQMERRLEKTHRDPERLARLKTLVHAGRSAAQVVSLGLAGLMMLHASTSTLRRSWPARAWRAWPSLWARSL